MCDLLNNGTIDQTNLHVAPPIVRKITNVRLGTEFKEREFKSEFADIVVEDDVTRDIDDEKMQPGGDLIDSVLNADFTGMLDQFQMTETNFHDSWIEPTMDLNILKTMSRQRISYQPKMILERVLNIKYQIITKLVTNINLLNKITMKLIYKSTKNIYIYYSLIYSYDSQFSDIETPSPNGCEFVINPTFGSRYIDFDEVLPIS